MKLKHWHNHPELERRLGVPAGHVIVDLVPFQCVETAIKETLEEQYVNIATDVSMLKANMILLKQINERLELETSPFQSALIDVRKELIDQILKQVVDIEGKIKEEK